MTLLEARSPIGVMSRTDVVSPETFAAFAQQKLGTPYPAWKDMVILKRQLKAFFAQYPDLDYTVLCKVVDWAKAKRRRPSQAYSLLACVRYAWADGALPDLDPVQRANMAKIR